MDSQVLVVIVIVGVWYFATIREGHIWNGDACMYLLHARNLVHGLPYGETGYIHNPAARVGPPTYPPVCPALLAPVYKLFGLDFKAMKAMMILCFLASLFAMSLVFRGRLADPYLITVIALIGFHPSVWDATDRVGSDLPFVLFTFVSLALIRAAYAAAPSWGHQVGYGLLVGIFMYLAYGARGLGLVLLPSLLLYHVWYASRLTGFTPFLVVAVAVFSILVPLQHRYLHSEFQRWRRVRIAPPSLYRQLLRYVLASYGLWYAGWPRLLHRGLIVCLAGCAGFGYWVTVWRGVTATDLFPLLYLASIMAWPVQYEMRRFLIPVLPFFVYYAGAGVAAIGLLTTEAAGTAIGVGFAATLLAWYVTRYAVADYGPASMSITSPAALALYQYVKRETNKKDVFVFFDPRILVLFTNRRTSGYHEEAEDGEMWRYFKEIGATYIGVGPADKEWFPFFLRFVDRYDRYMLAVYRNTEFVLYRIARFPF